MEVSTSTLFPATVAAIKGLTGPNGSLDMIEIGRIEQKRRVLEALTSDEQDVYEALLEHPQAALILSSAAHQYIKHLDGQTRKHGGTILRRTVRWRDGRRTTECRMERFPSPAQRQTTADGVGRTRPRARGAGRPKAQSTRSSGRSGDSGDSDPEPPRPRRLDGRRDIERWLAERKRALGALIRREQQRLDGEVGS